MTLPEVDVDLLAGRLLLIKPHLDERAWRLLLGAEAKVLGRGGIKIVAAAVGAHPDTKPSLPAAPADSSRQQAGESVQGSQHCPIRGVDPEGEAVGTIVGITGGNSRLIERFMTQVGRLTPQW